METANNLLKPKSSMFSGTFKYILIAIVIFVIIAIIALVMLKEKLKNDYKRKSSQVVSAQDYIKNTHASKNPKDMSEKDMAEIGLDPAIVKTAQDTVEAMMDSEKSKNNQSSVNSGAMIGMVGEFMKAFLIEGAIEKAITEGPYKAYKGMNSLKLQERLKDSAFEIDKKIEQWDNSLKKLESLPDTPEKAQAIKDIKRAKELNETIQKNAGYDKLTGLDEVEPMDAPTQNTDISELKTSPDAPEPKVEGSKVKVTNGIQSAHEIDEATKELDDLSKKLRSPEMINYFKVNDINVAIFDISDTIVKVSSVSIYIAGSTYISVSKRVTQTLVDTGVAKSYKKMMVTRKLTTEIKNIDETIEKVKSLPDSPGKTATLEKLDNLKTEAKAIKFQASNDFLDLDELNVASEKYGQFIDEFENDTVSQKFLTDNEISMKKPTKMKAFIANVSSMSSRAASGLSGAASQVVSSDAFAKAASELNSLMGEGAAFMKAFANSSMGKALADAGAFAGKGASEVGSGAAKLGGKLAEEAIGMAGKAGKLAGAAAESASAASKAAGKAVKETSEKLIGKTATKAVGAGFAELGGPAIAIMVNVFSQLIQSGDVDGGELAQAAKEEAIAFAVEMAVYAALQGTAVAAGMAGASGLSAAAASAASGVGLAFAVIAIGGAVLDMTPTGQKYGSIMYDKNMREFQKAYYDGYKNNFGYTNQGKKRKLINNWNREKDIVMEANFLDLLSNGQMSQEATLEFTGHVSRYFEAHNLTLGPNMFDMLVDIKAGIQQLYGMGILKDNKKLAEQRLARAKANLETTKLAFKASIAKLDMLDAKYKAIRSGGYNVATRNMFFIVLRKKGFSNEFIQKVLDPKY